MKFFKSILFVLLGSLGIFLGFLTVIALGYIFISIIIEKIPELMLIFNLGGIFMVMSILAALGAVGYFFYMSPKILKNGINAYYEWINDKKPDKETEDNKQIL